MTKRKPKSPYFVSAELLEDGTVKLLTDEHEEYHVEMRPEDWQPLISRCMRNYELYRKDPRRKAPEPAPPHGYGSLRLVK